jgi:hypothetical protein
MFGESPLSIARSKEPFISVHRMGYFH